MLTKTLIKYCSLFSRGVDKRRIRMFLESSPNYPNLLSVVQTLRYAGINVEVGRCDVDYLKSISGPVLLHLNLPGNQVMAIARPEVSGEGLSIFMPKTTKWEFRKFVDLVRVWDGVVVYAIDKPIGELLRQPSGTIYLILILLILVSAIWMSGNLSVVSIPLFVGLTASSLLYARLWGMNMGIIDGICHISSNADCDSVSSSNHGNILGFSLAALSLSYFLSQTLCMLFLCGEYALTGMYIVSSIVVIPMSAYSVYAQRKIGKYCVLCIVTLASLAAEAVICISLSNPAIDAGILGTWIIIFATILTILRVVDLLKVKVERGGKERLRFLSLKRKREIISMESRPCDGYETTLSIGPTNAPHTVTTILSTGCPHCRRTVADLLSMQERGIEFHWNIIFGETKSGDSDDVKAMIHAYFSDILLFKKQLKLWSEGRKFRPRDILSDIGSLPVETETYEYFRAFITREGISGLPVIILDGRKLSSVYEVKDLEYLIADNLINNL